MNLIKPDLLKNIQLYQKLIDFTESNKLFVNHLIVYIYDCDCNYKFFPIFYIL